MKSNDRKPGTSEIANVDRTYKCIRGARRMWLVVSDNENHRQCRNCTKGQGDFGVYQVRNWESLPAGAAAIKQFETLHDRILPSACGDNAMCFAPGRFRAEFGAFAELALSGFREGTPARNVERAL